MDDEAASQAAESAADADADADAGLVLDLSVKPSAMFQHDFLRAIAGLAVIQTIVKATANKLLAFSSYAYRCSNLRRMSHSSNSIKL